MADEPHEVVKLLVARMESHPKEFEFHASGNLAVTGRWETWIAQLGWHFNEAEKALIYGKARELIFQRVHEEVLDELFNGEDRRKVEEKEKEYEAERIQKYLMAQQQQRQQAVQRWQCQNGVATHIAGSGITGKSASTVVLDELLDMTPKPSLLQRSKSFFASKKGE
jgi:hypothetical protein